MIFNPSIKNVFIKSMAMLCLTAGVWQTSWAEASPIPIKIENTTTAGVAKVTAYLLMAIDKKTNRDSMVYLTQTLAPQIASKKIRLDRVVLSFLNPQMDPKKIAADQNNLQQLLIDSDLLPNPKPGDGNALKQAIQTLKDNHVQVYLAVGGWANSCFNPNNPNGGCVANFPLTKEIVADFSEAQLPTGNKLTSIQPIAPYSTDEYTNAWAQVAKILGADGIDLDYEENWFVAETTYHFPILAVNPVWAKYPAGPYQIPYSVIKYARLIKSLKDTTHTNGLGLSLAVSAAGAYNVHDHIGGSMFWCPVSAYGKSVCGQDGGYSNSELSIAGNLKGVIYDIVNYQKINEQNEKNKPPFTFTYNNDLFAGLLENIDSLNVMTYDLDDGYDQIGSSWCIGKATIDGKEEYSSRDPNTDGYKDVECSIPSQNEAIISMYRDNVLTDDNFKSGNKPQLGFGLEAGFPNYPINIEPQLSGGGFILDPNSQDKKLNPSVDPHYRWNDPFVAFDLPLQDYDQLPAEARQIFTTWLSTSGRKVSDDTVRYANVPDKHSEFLFVSAKLFNRMRAAGANGVIIWSLYNEDYDKHVSLTTSWDYNQLKTPFTAFSKDYSIYNYSPLLLANLFNYSASPEYMVDKAYKFYHTGN